MRRPDTERATLVHWPSSLLCLEMADTSDPKFRAEITAMLAELVDRSSDAAMRTATETVLRRRWVGRRLAEKHLSHPPVAGSGTAPGLARLPAGFPLKLALFIHAVRRFGLDTAHRTIQIDCGDYSRSTAYATLRRLPPALAALAGNDADAPPLADPWRALLVEAGPAHLGQDEIGPAALKRAHIRWALHRWHGVRAAAAALGIERSTVRRWR